MGRCSVPLLFLFMQHDEISLLEAHQTPHVKHQLVRPSQHTRVGGMFLERPCLCRWYYRPQELELNDGLAAEEREVFDSNERSTHPLNSGVP